MPTPCYHERTTYVYGLCDERGFLRYVGKSSDPPKRLRKHLRESRLNPKCHRECWLKGMQDRGLKPELFIIEEVPESEWQDAERFWIAYFKFLGCDLVNLTIGGDGLQNPTAEVRAKISLGVGNAHRGKPKSEEHRAKLRENIKKAQRASRSPEGRAKQSASRMGMKWAEETRRKQSELRKGLPQSECHRLNCAKAALARTKTYICTSPDGAQMTVTHLASFCRQRDLTRSNMVSVATGRLSQHKGWRCRHAEPPASD